MGGRRGSKQRRASMGGDEADERMKRIPSKPRLVGMKSLGVDVDEAADERTATKMGRSPSKRTPSKLDDDETKLTVGGTGKANRRLSTMTMLTGTLGGSKEVGAALGDSTEPPPGRGYSRRKMLLSQQTSDPV